MSACQTGHTLPPAAVIVPGKGYLIVGGERRVAATLASGARHVTLYALRTWQELFAWMLLDAAEEGWALRKPMNVVDAAFWTRKVLVNFKIGKRDAADHVLAEYVGLDVRRIREARYQLRWLAHPDAAVQAYAAAQFRLVAQGDAAPGTLNGRVTRFAMSRSGLPVKQQRTILASASGQMAGLSDALRPVADALSGELTDQEIDNALRHLGEGRKQIERVIRGLNAVKESRKNEA